MEPFEMAAPKNKSEDRQKGAARLRSVMCVLREELEEEDVHLLERLIAEGEQPADRLTPST
jgi:hypothetical protein